MVGILFTLATRASGGLTRERRRALPGLLAHSLVPIVVGYIFAHYATYLLEKGQSAFIAMLDPLGRGWEPSAIPRRRTSCPSTTHCSRCSRWAAS